MPYHWKKFSGGWVGWGSGGWVGAQVILMSTPGHFSLQSEMILWMTKWHELDHERDLPPNQELDNFVNSIKSFWFLVLLRLLELDPEINEATYYLKDFAPKLLKFMMERYNFHLDILENNDRLTSDQLSLMSIFLVHFNSN